MKIVKSFNKYEVKKVNNKCYQLVKIIEEFPTAEEAQEALANLLERKSLESRILNFNYVWQDILSIIEECNTIETLTSKKPNVIENVAPEGLLVTTDSSSSQLVKKEWIKSAWEALVKKGSITAEDIPGPARIRSSFIIALLASLEYVGAEANPNKIYISIK